MTEIETEDAHAQSAPPEERWSVERKDAWNAGYYAGLNDATKITKDALRDAMERKRDRSTPIPQPNEPSMNLLVAERDTIWNTIRSQWQVRK